LSAVEGYQEGLVKTSFGHSTARLGASALMLLGGLAVASAQIGSTPPAIQDHTIGSADPLATPRLSETQRSAIADAVRRDNKAVEPSISFVASVGAPVPPAIELYILPDKILTEVPAAKNVKYTVVKNQLLLVDPLTMRVVDIIPQ
jgi:hypothetical protein